MAAKATVHEPGVRPPASETATPTQTIIRSAVQTATRTDTRGRVITVRRVSGIQFYRLTKVLGAVSSTPASFNLALAAASVASIDGEEIGFPVNEREVEKVISSLDLDGLAAVNEALEELNPGEENEEAAKNSPATQASS